MSAAPLALTPPTQDERNMAMLAHVLQLFGGFIAPLIIFLVKRDSRFVRFHALQPLIWHATFFVIMMVAMFSLFLTMFLSIPMEAHAKSTQPPVAFFAMFGSVWLFAMGSWIINLFLAIFFGIKAYEGQWARYPVIGNLAWKWTAD
jgi:uncharacterized Tic20 family protein